MSQNINELLDQLNTAIAEYKKHMNSVDSFIENIDDIHPGHDQLVQHFLNGLPDHQEKAFYLLQKIGETKRKLLALVVVSN